MESDEAGKYLTGVRGMRAAPMGKSVFRLLRAAKGSIMNMEHQQPLKQYGHDALPFKPSGPVPPNTGVGK